MAYYRSLYYSETPNDFHSQLKINSTTGGEIVTQANVKDFARIDTSTDDDLIDRMITQARIVIENYIGKDIVAKNRTYFSFFEKDRFALPFAPVSSISSVSVQGSTATYESKGLDKEIVELNELPAKEIEVTYITTGLDDSLLKQAIIQLAATYYDNRSDFVTGKTVAEVPTNVKSQLSSFKNTFI